MSKGIYEEHCRSSSNGCAVGNTNPRTHTESVRKFPFTAHVGIDTNQKVKYDQLERSAIVQPFVKRSSFPDGVEVKADSIGTRNNRTGDDVVSVH